MCGWEFPVGDSQHSQNINSNLSCHRTAKQQKLTMNIVLTCSCNYIRIPTELPIVPEIVEHPLSSVEVAFGEAVEVCVKAIGKQPLQYTWYKNTKELFYASTAIVCIPNATRMDNGSYCCSVANEYGSVLSGSCQVKVVHKGICICVVSLFVQATS